MLNHYHDIFIGKILYIFAVEGTTSKKDTKKSNCKL